MDCHKDGTLADCHKDGTLAECHKDGTFATTLKCLFAKTNYTADSFDVLVKFSPLDALSCNDIEHLKNRECFCENAFLHIYDSQASCKCGNAVTSRRAEIRFSIFAEDHLHQCKQCGTDETSVCKGRSGSDKAGASLEETTKVPCDPSEETLPRLHSEQDKTLPRAHSEQDKTLPRAHTEQDETLPRVHSEQEETLPRVHSEQDETLPRVHTEQEEILPRVHSEQDNGECLDSDENRPRSCFVTEEVSKEETIKNTCGLFLEKITSEQALSPNSEILKSVPKREVSIEQYEDLNDDECYKCMHSAKSFCGNDDLASHIKDPAEEKTPACPDCGKVFNKVKALKRHKLNHHSNISVYICKVCKKGFTDEEKLRYHVFTDHKGNEQTVIPDQQYKCSICPKTFSKSSLLKNHLRLHRNGKPFRCLYCGITFRDELSFELHSEIHRGESGKPFTCKNCGHCFPSLTLLKKHKASHDGQIYKCSICDKIFQTGKSLRDHMNIHNGVRSYVCNICGKALVSANRLKSHLKTHIIDKPYKCDFCDKSFINPGDRANHRRVHTGEKPYLCEICGKGFAYKTSVPKHMVIHSDKKPFKCDVCNKEFASCQQMYNHKKIHLGLKNFICEVCGKRFTTGKALKVHKLMHEGYTGHSCDVCGKKYRNVYYLEIHKKTHTGRNLLQCHMCGDSFADPTYFKLHQKKFCKKVLIYCELCKQGFPNNKDLKSHMGFHSGERPYSCHVCGKAFAKSVFLTDHMKRHNPEALIRCSVCDKGFINKKEVRRHEARHKNTNKKRASPRISVNNDPNTGNQINTWNIEHTIPKCFETGLEPSTSVNAENHEKVLQEFVESIESIKKSVIPSPSGYQQMGRSDSLVNPEAECVSLVLPPGTSTGGAEAPPPGLPTSQSLILPAQDTFYYGHIDPQQAGQVPGNMVNPIDPQQTYPSVFTRESGEMLLMQEGLAAIMNQAERRAQTYAPQMEYYYPPHRPQQQDRFDTGEGVQKY